MCLMPPYALKLSVLMAFSDSVFHVENLLHPPDRLFCAFLCVVLCCPPGGPQAKKESDARQSEWDSTLSVNVIPSHA